MREQITDIVPDFDVVAKLSEAELIAFAETPEVNRIFGKNCHGLSQNSINSMVPPSPYIDCTGRPVVNSFVCPGIRYIPKCLNAS